MKSNILEVKLSNWKLKNPIIPASGTFGFGYEFKKYYDINILGSISFKATTVEPRFGNPLPRIAECDNYGLINSIGLQNPGVNKVIKDELPKLKKAYKGKVIANIAGNSYEEFTTLVKKLNNEPSIAIFEINISCPNIHHSKLEFSKNPKNLAELVKRLKKVSKKPIYVKLSAVDADIVKMACACKDAGVDGLVLINTLKGLKLDLNKRTPVIANQVGGYSGPAIKPIALGCVYNVRKAVGDKLPIIGIGGVCSAEDVIEFLMCGANAVQVGTANLIDPYACKKIVEDLPKVMKKYNIKKLSDIICAGVKE